MPDHRPCEICPVCQVRIDGDTVHFAAGNPGTRDRLYARVCQYAIARGKSGCINAARKPSQTALTQESWANSATLFEYDLGRLGLPQSPIDYSPVDALSTEPTLLAKVLGCLEANLRRLAEALATLKGLA